MNYYPNFEHIKQFVLGTGAVGHILNLGIHLSQNCPIPCREKAFGPRKYSKKVLTISSGTELWAKF